MYPQALGYKSYDSMLDAYNERPDKTQDFQQWYQHQLQHRPSVDCDHPNLPQVWIDQDDEDDGLMGVNAPKKPSPTNPTDHLIEFAPTPDINGDPKQLVHA